MSIKVYTLSTCPYCDKTIEFLKSNGVQFEAVVMDRLAGNDQEEAITAAYRLSGQRSYPVTDVNGTGVIGFDVAKFKKLLHLEAALEEQSTPVSAGFEAADDIAVEKIRGEAGQTGYTLHPDENIVRPLTSGLLNNQARYGYRSCPCRLSTGDYNKDCDIICPCAYRDWDLDTYGRCYCGLYVTEDFVKSGAKMTPIPDSRKYLSLSAATPVSDTSASEVSASCEILTAPFKPEVREVIKVFAYSLGKDGRENLREELNRIAKSLMIDVVSWHGETAEGAREVPGGGRLSLRFLQGMDGYVYIIRVLQDRDGQIGDNALTVCTDLLKGWPNELYQLDIIVGNRTDDLFAGEVKGEKLGDGITLFSGYQAKEKIRRYVIVPGVKSGIDKAVDDIVRLETCYNLLLSQRQKYLLLADQLDRLEERIAARMGVINLNLSEAEGDVLKGWLHWLSVNFGEVSGVTEEMKKHAADTEGRRNVLHTILERWQGQTVVGFQSISEPLRFYTRAIGDDYGRLTHRVEGIRREMGDVITILRTRVDLIQQEQSLDIQRSMHETAKTQLKMQRAVESLEIVIVTYYMTSLAKITFEALHAQGRQLPDKPLILAGYLIPVFFIFAIFLSGKIGHISDLLRRRKVKTHE